MTDEATVLMQIYLLHLDAYRAKKEDDQVRLIRLVDDFEWAFPEASAEVHKKRHGTS